MSFVYRKFLHLNFLRTFLLFASKLSRRVISEKKQCASYSSQFSASHPRHFPFFTVIARGFALPIPRLHLHFPIERNQHWKASSPATSSGPLLANPDLFVCKFALVKVNSVWSLLYLIFTLNFLHVFHKYKWS